MLEHAGDVRLASHWTSNQTIDEPEEPISVGAAGLRPVFVSPTGFILEDNARPASDCSTRWVLASRTSTRSTSTANCVMFVNTSSYTMCKRPSVPRTALGRLSTLAASPVNC